MGKVLVRYKVKPEKADENVSLVKAVYAELNEKKPAGLRYATFVAEDGLTFFHVAEIEVDDGPLRAEHDPDSPYADDNGYVYYPNIDPVIEQMNSMVALRAYEANIAAIEATKSMMSIALQMLA